MKKIPQNNYRIIAKKKDKDQRLDLFLKSYLSHLSRTQIKKIIETKFFKDTNKIANPSYKIKLNDVFLVTIPSEKEGKILPENIKLNVVFEDDDLVVINKPAGLIVHPGAGNKKNTLVNALLAYCGPKISSVGQNNRPGIVHRLDKETSGLIVVAKNNFSYESLTKQFSERKIIKKYFALVWGKPKKNIDTIVSYIGRSKFNRKKISEFTTRGKKAITHYKVIKTYTVNSKIIASLIECKLETGRTHQIRVHLSSLNNPILGDSKYGRGNKANHEFDNLLTKANRHLLHSAVLGFSHPENNKKMVFKSRLPPDFDRVISCLEELKKNCI